MCKLTVFSGKRANSLANVVYRRERSFIKSYDGFGLYVRKEGESPIIWRVPKDGFKELPKKLDFRKATEVVLHFRNASQGNAKVENTHPFSSCRGDFFLFHTGDESVNTLLLLLPKRHKIEGETDSEILTHFLCHLSQKYKSLELVLRIWAENFDLGSSFLVCDSEFLYALGQFNMSVLRDTVVLSNHLIHLVDLGVKRNEYLKFGGLLRLREGNYEILSGNISRYYPDYYSYGRGRNYLYYY